jgi:hypothetical protein
MAAESHATIVTRTVVAPKRTGPRR